MIMCIFYGSPNVVFRLQSALSKIQFSSSTALKVRQGTWGWMVERDTIIQLPRHVHHIFATRAPDLR